MTQPQIFFSILEFTLVSGLGTAAYFLREFFTEVRTKLEDHKVTLSHTFGMVSKMHQDTVPEKKITSTCSKCHCSVMRYFKKAGETVCANCDRDGYAKAIGGE